MPVFSDYWAGLQVKNSALNDESNKMTISVDSFKKQLKKAYHEGGKDEFNRTGRGKGGFGDLFGGMFSK